MGKQLLIAAFILFVSIQVIQAVDIPSIDSLEGPSTMARVDCMVDPKLCSAQ
jgi:hypothetical protein